LDALLCSVFGAVLGVNDGVKPSFVG
jgi:hypothetical protein